MNNKTLYKAGLKGDIELQMNKNENGKQYIICRGTEVLWKSDRLKKVTMDDYNRAAAEMNKILANERHEFFSRETQSDAGKEYRFNLFDTESKVYSPVYRYMTSDKADGLNRELREDGSKFEWRFVKEERVKQSTYKVDEEEYKGKNIEIYKISPGQFQVKIDGESIGLSDGKSKAKEQARKYIDVRELEPVMAFQKEATRKDLNDEEFVKEVIEHYFDEETDWTPYAYKTMEEAEKDAKILKQYGLEAIPHSLRYWTLDPKQEDMYGLAVKNVSEKAEEIAKQLGIEAFQKEAQNPTTPKPTTPAAPGYKWVWDESSQTWQQLPQETETVNVKPATMARLSKRDKNASNYPAVERAMGWGSKPRYFMMPLDQYPKRDSGPSYRDSNVDVLTEVANKFGAEYSQALSSVFDVVNKGFSLDRAIEYAMNNMSDDLAQKVDEKKLLEIYYNYTENTK